jgi:hypothetical protein
MAIDLHTAYLRILGRIGPDVWPALSADARTDLIEAELDAMETTGPDQPVEENDI